MATWGNKYFFAFTLKWNTARFNKTLYVSPFSSTGDGGTFTEVTHGNQRMNLNTWKKKKNAEGTNWDLDNHVARPGCWPTGMFCSVTFQRRCITSTLFCWHHAHEGLCDVNLQFWPSFKLFYSALFHTDRGEANLTFSRYIFKEQKCEVELFSTTWHALHSKHTVCCQMCSAGLIFALSMEVLFVCILNYMPSLAALPLSRDGKYFLNP